MTTRRATTTDLTGRTFGKLKVLSFSYYQKGKYAYWNCKCECGNTKVIYGCNLKNGSVVSCGCERKNVGQKYAKANFHIVDGVQIEKAIARSTPKNNTSGFRGVFKDKRTGKYRARIIMQGKRTELGYFEHFADAVEARIKAEEKLNKIVAEYIQTQNSPQISQID